MSMIFIDINYDEIYDYDWLEVGEFDLVSVRKDDGTKVQVYPSNVLGEMKSSDELDQYDDNCWKQFYCTGLHSKGVTPRNVIGACSVGCYDDLVEVVDVILSQKRKNEKG